MKIQSLQALRALAFMGIFLEHAGAPIKWPKLGVSFFLVLSGFLMYYQYDEKEFSCTIKANAAFSFGKIKKLYPLHIITMCFAIILYLFERICVGFTLKNIIWLIGTVGLNITLLQAWVPYSPVNVSLNGVAWYLSVIMFLYFMFPYIKMWIKKKKNRTLIIMCVFILFFEILICVPCLWLLKIDSPIYIWFMYCFPLFRLGDFFIGCCFGKYYMEKTKIERISFARASLYETITILTTILVFLWIEQKHKNIILLATQNWTTLYIPLAMMWILLFLNRNGIFTKLLSNKVMICIGNISAYLFLIHNVITLSFILIEKFTSINRRNIFVIIFEFLLTILMTMFYMKIEKRNMSDRIVFDK